MAKGGRRQGAGLPKGFKYPKTLEKERVLEACRQMVLKRADELFTGQIDQAAGLPVLLLDSDDGPKIATDRKQVEAWAASGGRGGRIWIKPPNTQAFQILTDRTFGKPKESHEHTGPDGGPIQQVVFGGRFKPEP